MDKRDLITQKVLMVLVKNNVEQEIIDETRAILEVELDKCEVYERCTDIVTVDTTPIWYLKQFLDIKRIEGKTDKTIKRYKYEIEKLLLDLKKPLKDISTSDIRVYIDNRKLGKGTGRQLSNRTLHGMISCYSSFFKWLVVENVITSNPCTAVGSIKYKKKVRKIFSTTELQRMREACDSLRDIALIDWFISTGCRVGEVSGAKLSDIDWNTKSILVIGKGNKERTVYFDDVTSMHLQKYILSRKDSCDRVFVNRSGNPLTVGGVQQIVKRIGRRAGIDDAHCHRFRHTFATYLVSKIPITDVAEIMGHESISTTQGYVSSDNDSVMTNYRRVMN